MESLNRTKPPGRRLGRVVPALIFAVMSLLSPDWSHLSWVSAAAGKDPPPGPDKAEVGIVTDQQMDFGQLADKDGSVTLGLADLITADPDLIHYGGSPYSGIYTITGDPNVAVDVSISSTPANGFTLDTFVSSEGGLPLVSVLLDAGGELVLTVGATLTLDAANVSVGSGQTINFTITSTYN